MSGLNYDKVVKNKGGVLLENLKNVKRERTDMVSQTFAVFCAVLYQRGWWMSYKYQVGAVQEGISV